MPYNNQQNQQLNSTVNKQIIYTIQEEKQQALIMFQIGSVPAIHINIFSSPGKHIQNQNTMAATACPKSTHVPANKALMLT